MQTGSDSRPWRRPSSHSGGHRNRRRRRTRLLWALHLPSATSRRRCSRMRSSSVRGLVGGVLGRELALNRHLQHRLADGRAAGVELLAGVLERAVPLDQGMRASTRSTMRRCSARGGRGGASPFTLSKTMLDSGAVLAVFGTNSRVVSLKYIVIAYRLTSYQQDNDPLILIDCSWLIQNRYRKKPSDYATLSPSQCSPHRTKQDPEAPF